MSDPHQVNIVIASALLDCFRQREEIVDTEEAKRIAKCVISALNDAGFQVAAKDRAREI
jgi:hypothetical protein